MTGASEDRAAIEASIRARFAALAREPAAEKKFPVGVPSARRLGYAAAELDVLPSRASESFAGVGNPFLLGAIGVGETVLDLGCGSGMDSLLAAERVGPSGRVIGVDAVPEMLERARLAADELAARSGQRSPCEFRLGDAAALPVADASIDVVITNGVFNLCVDKPGVVAELFRVLRPGGRLQMADILLEPHVTPEELASKGTWSD